MLQMAETVIGKPVLSLRTGQPVADILSPIINPDNLKIEGFYCRDNENKQELVLLYQDIRDILPQGVVVDDHDVLTDPEELIRLRKILELSFQLIGKPVETIAGEKVGKVSDYALEGTTMFIQKLYISQSILKSLTGGALSVDRTQIHEITSKKVIINELMETAPVGAAAAA